MGQRSASSAWGSAIKHSRARDRSYAVSAPSQATVTANSRQTVLSSQCVADHTICPAGNVGLSIRRRRSSSMRFLQLNVQKRRNMQHSMMNDVNLKEYAARVISEP